MSVPQQKSFLSDVVVAVMGLLAISTFFSFTLGLPWHSNGVWRQTEVASATFYGISGLLVACLATLFLAKDEIALGVMKSKVALLLGAFCLVGFVLAPFSDAPQRSIHGTMKHGAGAIWYLELFVLAISMKIVFEKGWAKTILTVGALSALVVTMCYGPLRSILGVPLAFEEWAGIASGLAGLALVLERDRFASKWTRLFCVLIAAFVVAYGYWVSDNRTVILCALVAAVFHVAWYSKRIASILDLSVVRMSIVTAITVVGMFAVYVSGPLIEWKVQSENSLTIVPASTTVLSNNPMDQFALDQGGLGTIWSRSYLVRVLVDDLVNHPERILTGSGWGGFEDAYERNARDLPGRTFYDNLPSASQTYWDGHHKANFHSHNMGVEVLYSVGLLGLVLWLGVFACLAATSRKGFYVALAISVYGTFWFPVNHATAFIALVIALALPVAVVSARSRMIISGLAPLGFVAAIVLIGLSVVFGKVIRLETFERGFVASNPDANVQTCGLYRTMLFPENEITWALYTLLNRRVLASDNPAQSVYDHTTSFINFTCMMRRYSLEKPDAVTLALSLKTRGQLVALGNLTFGALTDDIVNWGQDIDKFLTVAPKRTEFLAPYLNLLGQRSPTRAFAEIERYLPRLSEGDPLREYLLHLKSSINGDPVGAKTHMQKAVDLGFGNLWKVTPAMIKEYDLK
jgi:hypothetical protein